MKKSLLFVGISALSICAFAAEPEPTLLLDTRVTSISSNGKYAVSMGAYGGMSIINLSDLKSVDQWEYIYEDYVPGHGKNISDTGIAVGVSDLGLPEYWKDGEWHTLRMPDEVISSNLATAITPDGNRICGLLGISPLVYDDDALLKVPCVWEADGDGYGMPILLPHPDEDFAGRVPMYVTAIDISADGKVIVGQVIDAVGMINYPIIYKEDENGEWSYDIPYMSLINPDGIDVPKFPGEGPMMPSEESYMTPDELQEYNEAYQAYINSNYQLPYPKYEDYMSETEIEDYQAAYNKFEEDYKTWSAEYEKWAVAYQKVLNNSPAFIFNSILISPDGKSFGCTVEVVDMDSPNPSGWGYATEHHTWVLGVDKFEVTKYISKDLNITWMCDNGITLAATSVNSPNNSFVLQNGEIIDMLTWMQSQNPEYASWMEENMNYSYDEYNWDTDDLDYKEEFMTGRAVATPDLSRLILSVENIWDFMDNGEAVVFDLGAGSGVDSIRPTNDETTIYDLYGRKLNKASAPGIYIINGKKKVVR